LGYILIGTLVLRRVPVGVTRVQHNSGGTERINGGGSETVVRVEETVFLAIIVAVGAAVITSAVATFHGSNRHCAGGQSLVGVMWWVPGWNHPARRMVVTLLLVPRMISGVVGNFS
jgi:hypothetical protein